ncbi:MAG: tol-pal system protein YbgF [Gammaproteobacteria bacterium]|nr:tol-pal system protein YbgF [Gammaproteobacteria bacterium]
MKNLFLLSLLVTGGALAQPVTVVDVSNPSQPSNAQYSAPRSNQGRIIIEMQQHIDSLQQELNELRGITETHNYRLDQMLQRQRELYQEIDKRFSSLQVSQPEPVVTEPAFADNSDNSDLLSMTQVYDNALNLALKEKRFDQAIVEFKRYLVEFPQSTYSANSHYWLGQLLFNQSKIKAAQLQFEQLVEQYPQSAKRADAMVKLGKIAQNKKQKTKAKELYNQVIKQYPEKSAAKQASSLLAELR